MSPVCDEAEEVRSGVCMPAPAGAAAVVEPRPRAAQEPLSAAVKRKRVKSSPKLGVNLPTPPAARAPPPS